MIEFLKHIFGLCGESHLNAFNIGSFLLDISIPLRQYATKFLLLLASFNK